MVILYDKFENKIYFSTRKQILIEKSVSIQRKRATTLEMKIYKIYLLLLILNILVQPIILLFTAYKQYYYFTNGYKTEIMSVEKSTSGSSSKRKSVSVEGTINKKPAFFGLFDDDAYNFLSYLNDSQLENLQNIDYGNLKPLNLHVRVVQFGDSKNVMYIKKYQTAEEALEKNLLPWIIIEFVFAGLLLIFYFLKPKQTKK
ncbi:hypothetical protein IW18_09955 [Flavobacterium hibernum]|uniref:Uncharacterized protein n=2 Tax=Flavobacterium hibernum TaxID=37752 RepID=A0A0D0F3Z9_9FLAO|nr:hypothetical protein IW18_09955 [Flavobacterium hibernum]OXA88494.1 hypothetical protein B0A73_07365 [Flavobacterium hibernum]STO15379.1 Uncharacterised protein [Flavobacterium hibernum]